MKQMSAGNRREAVLRRLDQSEEPVSASTLAEQFAVSRQIIVGDIALLRASGAEISATPRGYVSTRAAKGGVVRHVACVHTGADMGKELTLIVDAGGEVLDVIVEHPLYGQITGMLQIRSRYDVSSFLNKVAVCSAKPLSELTEGIHLHTIRCPDEAVFARVCGVLEENGFLVPT